MRSLRLRRDLGLQVLALYLIFVGLVVASTLVFENFARRRLQADVQAGLRTSRNPARRFSP